MEYLIGFVAGAIVTFFVCGYLMDGTIRHYVEKGWLLCTPSMRGKYRGVCDD